MALDLQLAFELKQQIYFYIHSYFYNLCDSYRWLSPDLVSSEDADGTRWNQQSLLRGLGGTNVLTGHARMPKGWATSWPSLTVSVYF